MAAPWILMIGSLPVIAPMILPFAAKNGVDIQQDTAGHTPSVNFGHVPPDSAPAPAPVTMALAPKVFASSCETYCVMVLSAELVPLEITPLSAVMSGAP
ncbi:hypothetical protein GALL_503430 [mine drainage metagenome]|uniref:Uncharacterized protein n=1 Tax=mine drainage metagenome TaxID=410659 RepID=A0A1J5PJU9_9ZZZZ